MSFERCAEIVLNGDPDRFLATMAAPVAKRGALFAVYAFNVEVTRAAWASAEPMICEIRLQWWLDALNGF
ncbi:MAG: squalene/phytoene synthase family protein, partial [Paracoccaceae bacterium]